MSREVDSWLAEGRERCKQGDHWFTLDYGEYLLCPICGKREETERKGTSEYNCWIVRGVEFKKAEQCLTQ